jgi:SNF2 family DNA or RNA helicase
VDDVETQIFLTSVLNYEFDEDTGIYSYDKASDIVERSRIVTETVAYLERQGEKCNIDVAIKGMSEARTASDKEFENSKLNGKRVLSSRQRSIAIPGFTRKLKNYQVKPVMHLIAVNHAANFSVPGSGKTTTTYAAYSVLKKNHEIEKLIVIGPRSAFMPWEDEFLHCFGRRVTSLRVSGILPRDSIVRHAETSELVLVTYQMAANRINALIQIMQNHKTMLVLDESHYVKSFGGGIRAAAVLKIAPYARKRVILSGTPVPHSMEDLWTQMTFLWPHRNLLGQPLAFRQLVQQPDGLRKLRDQIYPFYCRVMKHELNLPKQAFNRVLVPLGRYQRSIYRALAAKTLVEIPNEPTDRLQLAQWRTNKMIRLLQAASNPTLLNKYSKEFRMPPLSGKGLGIVSIMRRYSDFEIPSKIVKCAKLALDLLDSGKKVIIWSSFIHNILMLEKSLSDRDPLIIYGDVPKDDEEKVEDNRERRINEFKNDKRPRVLIANPSSCAESISLHKVCRHAIYLDRTFNAAHFMQSLDRIHRIGLSPSENVSYTILISRGTIDEVVDRKLRQKHSRMLSILNDDIGILNLNSSIKEFTADEEIKSDFSDVRKHLLSLKAKS